MKRRRTLWGFAHRRECLVPTWQGWLLLALIGTVLVVTAVVKVHSFLAITEPVRAGVLVVEGWVPDFALEEARAEFDRHGYGKLYVTGGPLETGNYLSEYKTYAELGVARLVQLGVRTNAIEAVPAPPAGKDRTYASAVTLMKWLHQRGEREISINVLSVGVHARRSRLLFQKAFGGGAQVGIIAIEDRNYDSRHWWKSSQGVRVVVDELVAFSYAVFIFPFA